MAKPLVLQFGGADLPFQMEKVDRAKLYGFIETEAEDEKGRPCRLATLAGDGRTILAQAGSAIALLSPEGNWLEKSKLSPVDREGKPVTPAKSSFGAPIPLAKKATIEEYLSCNVKSIYLMRCEGDVAALAGELKAGTIYSFPFSFRGGLEADQGFLLANAQGDIFLAVGQPTKIHFVGLDQFAAAAEEEEAPEGEGDDTLDFGML